jgi:hypothetical protein
LDVTRGQRVAELGDRAAAGQNARQSRSEAGNGRTALPLGGVARGDVTDFVAEDAGYFRFARGKAEQAAGDVDIPTRQGEGVDVGSV